MYAVVKNVLNHKKFVTLSRRDLATWSLFCSQPTICLASRSVSMISDSSQPSYTLSAAVVPQWKKDLADKRRQRADSGIVQTSNKENQPKTSPEIPQWKREFSERRKRRENSAVRQQPDGLDWSADASEWKQRLSTSRRIQTNVIPKSETDASPDPVPSFMKEFEKKKKRLPRGRERRFTAPFK